MRPHRFGVNATPLSSAELDRIWNTLNTFRLKTFRKQFLNFRFLNGHEEEVAVFRVIGVYTLAGIY